MWRSDPEHYFEYGETALRCIQPAMAATDRASFENILDFPSGHGRVLRTLKAEFPRAHLTACDIDPDAVDFCAQTFGAKPIYSAEDPSAIDLPREYDLIWCGSLLTHLDAPRWRAFLGLFEAALRPYGLFVITTAGRYCAELARRDKARGFWWSGSMLAAYDRTGFGYSEYGADVKEEISITTYGQSIASLRWVIEQLEELKLLRIVFACERAWHGLDAIACQKGPYPGLGAEES
jgi:SAM-dependent methyltransferase